MNQKNFIKWNNWQELVDAAHKDNPDTPERDLALDLFIEMLHIDPLTGLKNSKAMKDEGLDSHVAMLTFEDIHWINEKYGWGAGDYLVCRLAEALGQLQTDVYRFRGIIFILTSHDPDLLQNDLERLGELLAGARAHIAIDGLSIELDFPRYCYGTGRDLAEAETALWRARQGNEWIG